jgi:hypothetical protein
MPRWRLNHGNEMPRNLLFFDTESYRTKVTHSYYDSYLHLRLGVSDYVNWRGRRKESTQTSHFRDSGSFWGFLNSHLRPKETLWVFAHNIMFDLSMVKWGDEISAGRFRLCDAPNSGSVKHKGKGKAKVYRGVFNTGRNGTIIKCLYNGKRVNFIDTYNYFRTSVDKIGDSIGIQKLPIPADDDTEERWWHYCSRDVDIIREAMCGLMLEWESAGNGNWQPTIAGLAFSSYRHMHMSVPPCPHRNTVLSGFESKSYHDGRTQLFWRGEIRNKYSGGSVFGSACKSDMLAWKDGPAYVLDVSSLYPYVMRQHPFPRRVIGRHDGTQSIIQEPELSQLTECLDYCMAIATVELRTNDDLYPMEYKGRLIYPVGDFITTLCTPELRVALDNGHVGKVWAMSLYEPADLFTEFVDYWWKRRLYWIKRNNKVKADMIKDLMNSLHGKLGQHNRYWENIPGRYDSEGWREWPEIKAGSDVVTHYRAVGKQVQVQIDDGWSDYALVATSAHVNSYARVYMTYLRNVAGRDNVYYQGNDSLIVSGTGYDRLNSLGLIKDRELGFLKLEGTYEELKLWGSRDYEKGDKVVKAGLPPENERLSTRQWRFDVFEDSDTLLHRQPDGTVRITKRLISGSDPHEILHFDANGWYVPIRLSAATVTGG